jgi:hypothetical protein
VSCEFEVRQSFSLSLISEENIPKVLGAEAIYFCRLEFQAYTLHFDSTQGKNLLPFSPEIL